MRRVLPQLHMRKTPQIQKRLKHAEPAPRSVFVVHFWRFPAKMSHLPQANARKRRFPRAGTVFAIVKATTCCGLYWR
jgi:hypothetical protein